ncbi:GNAT family N-acetyltransferase [Williamsia muralis]|uniref:GNAT family protein n=1 Tax=Williamsia marianensis TaxID=85044 RepID=A0ABU4EQ26_WILMA|nr:GNAT family protein [Williamsia muralis]MDV7133336.1 GNAT family protein [Williamsia muralis]
MTWYTAPTLSGARIMLRELVPDDAPALAAAVDRPEAFRWTTVPGDVAAAERYIQTALDTPDRVAFAVVEQDSGRVVGSTSYYDITPDYRALAIGHTWYSAAVHGTAVNPEAKLLLLRRAFEDLSAVRVVWHTDERNAQSRAGIAKLGATFEGLLRKHRPLPDGSWRTTAQYAMTDDDWPAAREALSKRLER